MTPSIPSLLDALMVEAQKAAERIKARETATGPAPAASGVEALAALFGESSPASSTGEAIEKGQAVAIEALADELTADRPAPQAVEFAVERVAAYDEARSAAQEAGLAVDPVPAHVETPVAGPDSSGESLAVEEAAGPQNGPEAPSDLSPDEAAFMAALSTSNNL